MSLNHSLRAGTLLLTLTLAAGSSFAQYEHRVNQVDGSTLVDPIMGIDSISFDLNGGPTMHIQRINGTFDQVDLQAVDSVDFAPVNTWTFVDTRDGNVYTAITIGDQCWMAENLRYLPEVTHSIVGGSGTHYYVFGYNGYDTAAAKATENYQIYGALYSWGAASGQQNSTTNPSGVQGVCPDGWHLPSDAEVKQLEVFLGMTQAQADGNNSRGTDQGSRLAGTTALWSAGALRNDPAFGSSGFNMLPGSVRNIGGWGAATGQQASFWTTTYSGGEAWFRTLYHTTPQIYRSKIATQYGMSVRCVCDQ
jgi:uncharacterized protein (TIGR02145 family)